MTSPRENEQKMSGPELFVITEFDCNIIWSNSIGENIQRIGDFYLVTTFLGMITIPIADSVNQACQT
jgi:hypothetical protein